MASFEADIRPMFRRRDVNCMSGFGIALDDYAYMSDVSGNERYADHANARHVLCFLEPNACAPRMPYGGPYWTEEQLALYRRWMDEGFQP